MEAKGGSIGHRFRCDGDLRTYNTDNGLILKLRVPSSAVGRS